MENEFFVICRYSDGPGFREHAYIESRIIVGPTDLEGALSRMIDSDDILVQRVKTKFVSVEERIIKRVAVLEK